MTMYIALILAFTIWSRKTSANSVITAVDDEIPYSPRHIKIYNFTVNPDQHSWCEMIPIHQIVTHANCEPKEMANYVCVGTCFSYSVPQTEPETPGDEQLDYCESCQASQSHWYTVTLSCKNDGITYQVTKNIQNITDCACSSCQVRRHTPISNDVMRPGEHRISELFYKKMLPDSHKNAAVLSKGDLKDDMRYSQVSLGDLKKEFNLNPDQELLLSGKLLVRDDASFRDAEMEEMNERGFGPNK